MSKLLVLVVVAIATAATFACGGGDEEPSSTASTPVASSTNGAATNGSSPDPAEAALAAAIELVDGVPEADCTTNNPEQKDCVSLDSNDRGIASLGIAVLGVRGPAGGPSALVMGRDAEGEWAYYAGGQQYYQASELPGPMQVCAFGDGLNVRVEPSSDADLVTTVQDDTSITAEEFVLTEPGTPPPESGVAGYGWYEISAPVEGWVYSKYVSGLPDCSLHDSLETS